MRSQDVLVLRGGGPSLLVRRQQHDGAPILCVHGATFPSALSVGYRFAGRSWMDDLNSRGLDAWAFDCAGYGGSDRYPEMAIESAGAPPGRATVVAAQIARVIEHVVKATGRNRVSILAHSWGTIAAGIYASAHAARVNALSFFGPIARRTLPPSVPIAERWRLVSIAQQLARFTEDVPPGHPPVLIEPQLHEWGPAYLATDPGSNTRNPPAVKVPAGPVADIADAWAGKLAYRPEEIVCPVLIVRGEWDHVSNDADAHWLLSRLSHPLKRDAKIPKGTHLMHLEHSREGLFAAVGRFLREATS